MTSGQKAIGSRELRYNPRYITKPFSKVYRPWFFAVAALLILTGIGSLGCAIAAKEFYGDLHNELYHLWVGIPLIAIGLVAILVFLTRSRRMVTVFLMVSIVVMVICIGAALVGGLRYWRDGWSQTRRKLITDGQCNVVNNICVCRGVTMPARLRDCDDLKHAANLMISEIAMAAGGFFFSMAAVYLSMMAICCGPWQYLDENTYDKQYDPDFTDPSGVEIRRMQQRSGSGTDNAGFSG